MKKERKEELLHCFPGVPYSARLVMNSKGHSSENFCVFLASQNILFIRGFHRFANGRTEERQRFVFAEDGCCRYGLNSDGTWSVRREFTEPRFYLSYYGYHDNRYTVLCRENIKETCMRYSAAELYSGNLLISYLKYWQKHHNAEYLVKSGYSYIIESKLKGYHCDIDWSSNNLLKMLHLNRTEFKALQGKEERYPELSDWRRRFPEYPPDELLDYSEFFTHQRCTTFCDEFMYRTGLSIRQLYIYFKKNNVSPRDYSDYLRECRELKYDLKSSLINRPKHFLKAHERTANLVEYIAEKKQFESFENLKPERKILEFSADDIFIRQPGSIDEIIEEGARLNHCVGGYAERHALGKLHIMFIRARDKPDVPFYTVEISTDGDIVQVRGFRNCQPTEEVDRFVEMYRLYLAEVFSKKEKKTA